MIRVFYGTDRVRANSEIARLLGPDHEVYEGTDLTPADLPSLFLGTSLFNPQRKILIRDFFANKPTAEKLLDYLTTPHEVVIFELKLDKRATLYKTLKDQVLFKEFALPKDPNLNLIFEIYRVAKSDGPKALAMLEKVKASEDPMLFFGLIVSQAIKDYQKTPGNQEKKALRELSSLDLKLKSTSFQPWLLIESFLLRLASL
ncbi:hypothetical protein IKF73_02810 [Candidatus Saccharibacteria bacterium]|nr:hypothetical protein [Candidatus Saccharibacteria bacterium]